MVTTLIVFLSTARELLCESFLPVRFLPPEKRDESPTHKHVAHSESACSVFSLLDMCGCLRLNIKPKEFLINRALEIL